MSLRFHDVSNQYRASNVLLRLPRLRLHEVVLYHTGECS